MNKSLIAVPCFIALLGLSGCNTTTDTTYANNYPYSVGYVNLQPVYWGNGAYYANHGWGWNNNNYYWRNQYHHAGYYGHHHDRYYRHHVMHHQNHHGMLHNKGRHH
ncbi:MAG: hypothetical protein A3F18_00090 [Legionellales bacterium RIFCSPHIGHO2_12_FULL_37_14]|nr:MAG: hypothetical protein A3F18_00090 [Legionellales bacterium RIFCSPHIGHO2_12_FULL_37_14]